MYSQFSKKPERKFGVKRSAATSGVGLQVQTKLNDKNSVQQAAVPPIINEIITSQGEPLDMPVRSYFEPRFGHDFSKVRVHKDDRAGSSALQLGAMAYTVGRNVIFGNGQYAPDTQPGRRLIAHELTHVVQQDFKPASTPIKIAAKDDNDEQVAERISSSAVQQNSFSNSPAISSARIAAPGHTIQRSLLGGILGGLGGAAGGAILGGMLGGPLGAVVGGIAGFVAGAIIGDDATTKSRALTQTEIDYAKDVYRDSIDYSKIKITRDSIMATGAPRTIGNTINLKSSWRHFEGDTLVLTKEGLETLIHEMGHVWQYQNGGLAYIPDSLWSQLKAKLSGKSRNAAYDWKSAHTEGLPWEEWNPEQQASAIEQYNKLLRKSNDGTAAVEEIAELATLTTYMENVWQRRGAPSFAPAAFAGVPA
ncbi:MAG: DUF4157 domain-containing protein [Ginsengibacter sp.]